MKRFIGATLLLFILACAALTQEREPQGAQAGLVAAERAFAKLTVERGLHHAFLTYFADDGIGFGPHPYKVKEALSRQPPPSTRSPIVLNWAPVYGDISRAGDLGYNTGPTVFEDTGPEKRPTRHGLFFSVWKKQPDGVWRVALDLGGDTPAAVAPLDAPFRAAPPVRWKHPFAEVNVERESKGLLQVERELLAAAKTGGVGRAWQSRLSDDARIQRSGLMPVSGKEALRSWLAAQTATLDGEPLKAEVARSGELGYAYGRYESGGAKAEKGYYARVWKRDEDGVWKIVLDTQSPLPPETEESRLNAEGYRLLGEKKTKEAIEVFKRALAAAPNSANAYDSLSDAYEADGQIERAIEFAQKALEMLSKDPSSDKELVSRIRASAADKLKRLKGQ